MKLKFVDQKQFLYIIRELAKENKVTPQIMLQEVILDEIIDRISMSGLKSIFETDFKRHSEPRLPSTAQINH